MSKNRGVVYVKPGVVEVRDIADPKFEDPHGRKINHAVILKIVSTNICGSDQHMVRGCTSATAGLVLGHEITGEVIEKGVDVEFIDDGTFQGLELEKTIKTRDGEPRCGAFIVDTHNGDILHWIRFEGAVRELFDVSFIPGVGAPMSVGLGSPEMRTLVTIAGEKLESPTGLKA